jgi:hypothetical protein
MMKFLIVAIVVVLVVWLLLRSRIRFSAESSMLACSTAAPNRPYEPTPSTQCSGAQGEPPVARGSPGKAQASSTAPTPTIARARRTPGSGTRRLSSVCTASTSQTVSDSTGPNPSLAPPPSCPRPPISSTSSTACSTRPAASAAGSRRPCSPPGNAARA